MLLSHLIVRLRSTISNFTENYRTCFDFRVSGKAVPQSSLWTVRVVWIGQRRVGAVPVL